MRSVNLSEDILLIGSCHFLVLFRLAYMENKDGFGWSNQMLFNFFNLGLAMNNIGYTCNFFHHILLLPCLYSVNSTFHLNYWTFGGYSIAARDYPFFLFGSADNWTFFFINWLQLHIRARGWLWGDCQIFKSNVLFHLVLCVFNNLSFMFKLLISTFNRSIYY